MVSHGGVRTASTAAASAPLRPQGVVAIDLCHRLTRQVRSVTRGEAGWGEEGGARQKSMGAVSLKAGSTQSCPARGYSPYRIQGEHNPSYLSQFIQDWMRQSLRVNRALRHTVDLHMCEPSPQKISMTHTTIARPTRHPLTGAGNATLDAPSVNGPSFSHCAGKANQRSIERCAAETEAWRAGGLRFQVRNQIRITPVSPSAATMYGAIRIGYLDVRSELDLSFIMVVEN